MTSVATTRRRRDIITKLNPLVASLRSLDRSSAVHIAGHFTDALKPQAGLSREGLYQLLEESKTFEGKPLPSRIQRSIDGSLSTVKLKIRCETFSKAYISQMFEDFLEQALTSEFSLRPIEQRRSLLFRFDPHPMTDGDYIPALRFQTIAKGINELTVLYGGEHDRDICILESSEDMRVAWNSFGFFGEPPLGISLGCWNPYISEFEPTELSKLEVQLNYIDGALQIDLQMRFYNDDLFGEEPTRKLYGYRRYFPYLHNFFLHLNYLRDPAIVNSNHTLIYLVHVLNKAFPRFKPHSASLWNELLLKILLCRANQQPSTGWTKLNQDALMWLSHKLLLISKEEVESF